MKRTSYADEAAQLEADILAVRETLGEWREFLRRIEAGAGTIEFRAPVQQPIGGIRVL